MTPYVIVHGTPKLIDFLTGAFGAKERMRVTNPDGSISHAEVEIGDSIVMMGEASREFPAMPGSIHLYVKDADANDQRALKAGAKSLREPADQPYGDRSAGIKDPVGNVWWISTHIEDVSLEEFEKRQKARAKQAR